jgi:dienelactone hydrolase
MLSKKVYLTTLILLAVVFTHAQDKATFIATDKLIVTGDLYMSNDTLPYMILCHEQKSSRGEYKETAKKFMKLGYNIIAIDLRNGDTRNGVANETSTLAGLKHLPANPIDAKLDIEAAIAYAHNKNAKKKVVLVGSGYSASLALYLGATDPRVAGVLAFSPADAFGGKLDTKSAFSKYLGKAVFVSSSKSESADVKKYISAIPSTVKLVQFIPTAEGAHGSAALTTSDTEYHDYWISILMFMRLVQP